MNEIIETEEVSEIPGILENDPLGDLFSTEEKVKEVEAVTAPEVEEPVIEKPAVTAEPTKPVKDENEGFKAAYFAEKEKRQALEARQREPEKEREFDWTNPEKTLTEIETNLSQKFEKRFLEMSEYQCKARHEDYGDKYNVFVNMAKENPHIVQTMLQQPDPAEYVYKIAAQKMLTDEIGADPETYRARIVAEERAKWEAELNQKSTLKKNLASKLPPSAAKIVEDAPINKGSVNPYEQLFPGQVAS